ncbi:MAG: hypothetical protein CHACPFDD_01937 [Phycisphaerae bacterium]|nr:hypothetical protein [Phycisphaerae bacterium]
MTRMFVCSVALWTTASYPAEQASERCPEQLVKLERERAAWSRFSVEWTDTVPGRPIPRRHTTSRYAGDDAIMVIHGDDEGTVGRDRNGNIRECDFGPDVTLARPGEFWHVPARGSVDHFARQTKGGLVYDLRTLGLTYVNSLNNVSEALRTDDVAMASPRKYEVSRDGDIETVSAITDYGKITWRLDSVRGGLPVRVTLERDGRVIHEARSSLRRFGDVWFPDRVEFYSGGREPIQIVEVHSIAINQPDMKTGFKPEDVGLDCGTYVMSYDDKGFVGPRQWTGASLVPPEEFDRRLKAGELQWGASFLAKRASQAPSSARGAAGTSGSSTSVAQPDQLGAASPNRRLTEWEEYTAEFVRRHALLDEQAQKAWQVCRRCQTDAREYLAAHRAELKTIETRIAALRSTDPSEAREGALVGADSDYTRLLKRLDDIFETRLKPDLEKIPTRAQRHAVDEAQKSHAP